MKAVVVYYTRFGHNKAIAETVARELGADLRRIETPREHGYAVMGFCSFFDIRMAIRPMDFDLKGVELVVLCCPVWAGKPAPPARAFLADARLEGRRLAVCFSSGGGSSARARDKVRHLLAGRNVNLVACGDVTIGPGDEAALRVAATGFAAGLKQPPGS